MTAPKKPVTPTYQVDMPAWSEYVDTLTGTEEELIEQHVGGFDIYSDSVRRGVRGLRCLVLVERTRRGDKPAVAKKTAWAMSYSDLQTFFAPEPDDAAADLDEDDPDTESGKDDDAPA